MWLALLGFVYAQAATVAYACHAPAASALHATHVAAQQSAAPTHCGGMSQQSDPNPGLCQAHCQADQQADSPLVASLPPVAMAPPLTIALREAGTTAPASSSFRARGAAQPPPLLFSRLLI